MSWASGTNKITASGADNSISGATGLSEVTELNANHKVYFVDVSSITGFSITNLDVDLLVESQPNSTQFLF